MACGVMQKSRPSGPFTFTSVCGSLGDYGSFEFSAMMIRHVSRIQFMTGDLSLTFEANRAL
jgi:hypothetical protein